MNTLTSNQKNLLNKILSKVGDLNFKRRILTMLEYLDIQETDKVLDIGCGEGFYSLIFEHLYDCNITAVDYDKKIVTQAKEWLKDSRNVTLEIGDITNLKYKNNTFDKIVCTEVLEHLDDDEKAIKELYRVLKPGGILAATVPNKNYPLVWDPLNKIRESLGLGHFDPKNGLWGGIWAYDHKRLYSPNDFEKLAKSADFHVCQIDVLTHYGVPFNHLILYVGKYLYSKTPVPEEVKNTMEKFQWDKPSNTNRTSIISKLILLGFNIIKLIDKLNDRKFSLDTSTMAVAMKCTKRI